jgi:hypothetical protein
LRAAVLILPLMLAACGTSDKHPHSRPLAPPVAPTDTPALAFDGRGLVIGANRTVLPFGASQEQVEAVVGRIFDGRAKAKHTHSNECGAGPMDSAQFLGLTLNFQDGRFVGIFVQGPPGIATLGPLTVGLSRSEAERLARIAMMPDSTLGQEFAYPDTDGMAGGFFDGTSPGAKISGLYAGITCFFR